jgi:uncharacterized membrane protein
MIIPSSPIVLIHLCIILPCAVFGTYLIFAKKGTQFHKTIGKVYMVLMAITGILTLFIPAQVGQRIFNHFGLLHLLSLLTIYSVPKAWFAIKRGDVKTHKSAKQGQKVSTGALLGLCGNSGNSSEAHLHFHLQNVEDMTKAIGAKCYFDQLKVNGVLKSDYSPVKGEKIEAGN